MKSDKNREIYDQAADKYLNSIPPGPGNLQNSQKYLDTRKAMDKGPPPKRLTPAE